MADEQDTSKTLKLLHTWENAKPNDPELYIAYFNFYFNKSAISSIVLEASQKGKLSLKLKDPKTNQIVAYLNEGASYDKKMIDNAFYYINIGIDKFPSRLDMRFGKIYALGKIADFKAFSTELT